jgi:DNA-binding transcriptional MerR regulator
MREIQKLYFSIGEVSRRTGLAPHVLRYWETEFSDLRPKKNRAGNRVYTEQDIQTLEHIQYLLKDKKYTIEGARQALRQEQPDEAAERRFVKELSELRGFLVGLLDRL